MKPNETSYRSFLGKQGYPRGIRNNNPGNLILTNIPWRGKVPNIQNTDGQFEQFISFPFGIRAMIKDIFSDINKGNRTLGSLMYEYAPPSENNTEAYISFITNKTGISRNETLTKQKEQTKRLVQAIAWYENGGNYVLNSDFEQAWSLL
jgi:hypothetical protein